MISSETDEITEERFESLLQRYKKRMNQKEKVALVLTVLIYCITILIKQV